MGNLPEIKKGSYLISICQFKIRKNYCLILNYRLYNETCRQLACYLSTVQ